MIQLINLSLISIIFVLTTNVANQLNFDVPKFINPLIIKHNEVSPPSPSREFPHHHQVLKIGTSETNVITPVITPPSKDFYNVIAEKDLFHPTRKKRATPKKITPRKLPEKSTKLKAPKPKDRLPRRSPTHPKKNAKKKRSERLALQGVVIFGDYQRALIADLLRKPRDPMDVGIGDTVGRFTVKEILEDSVILSAGETETRTLELMAEDKLNRRSHVVTAAPGGGPTRGKPAMKKKRSKKKTKTDKRSSE